MKTTKRLLSIVLVLAMLLTMASFPAFAEDTYTYTPKAIELEAAWGNRDNSEPRWIARPAEYGNIFVGDYLALPEGGLTLVKKPTNIKAANAPTGIGAAVAPIAFVIDVFQNHSSYNVNAGIQEASNNHLTSTEADGKVRFYFAIDYTLSERGTITGIYNNMEDMMAGIAGDTTKAIKGIELKSAGIWAVGLAHAVALNASGEPELCVYHSQLGQSYASVTHNAAPYMFTFRVKETPTSEPVELTAPEVPAGITASDIKSTANFVYDPYATNFSTSNTIYARSYAVNNSHKVYEIKRQIIGSTNVAASFSGFAIDMLAPAYIDTMVVGSDDSFAVDYYVYGSMDGENWYKISDGKRSDTAKGKTHTFVVKGIAKYFRIDIHGYTGNPNSTWDHTSYGKWKSTAANLSITGVLNVLQGKTVTVSGAYEDELETDANGKAGFDFDNYPAGKEEGKYIYKIDDVDVTDTIFDYVFTANTEVTVTKYVKPIGHLVTFTDGTTTKEVYADEYGYYEVPEIFKGNFSYYKDSYYAIKLDVTAPVNEATTVYVKAEPWSYIPKTVEFGIKKISQNEVSFAVPTNGPVVAPRETIYVGDTMVLPLEAYEGCVLWTAGTGGELTALDMTLCRFASTEEDDGFVYNLGKMTDVTFTFKEPGIYSLRTNGVYGVKADGTEFETKYGVEGSSTANGCYNCVIEVLPEPTSAPKTVVAPTTTATGEAEALLDSNFDTSVAFKKSYGKGLGYNEGGEGNSVVALNKQMGTPNDETGKHPISQTQYIQFNLPSLSYVTDVSITPNDSVFIYDYDAYGSMDGENWYLLNSGIVNNKKYAVNGVARYVRIVVRATDGWSGERYLLTAYKVNGYVIDESTVTTPAASWVKADGTKEPIVSVKSLPVAYSDGTTNYAITGWKVETGNGFAKTSLVDIAKNNSGDIYAIVEEIPFDADALMATLEEQNADAVGEGFDADNYINGFYVQGAQVRVDQGTTSGLRFINVIDNNLIKILDDLKSESKITGYEKGTVVIAETKYNGGDLVIDYSDKARAVKGVKTFAAADGFNDEYFKYTVCVTNIEPVNYTTNVIVRPYLTITKEDGSTITLYGEQYAASVYGAALKGVGNEELQENNDALQAIIDYVEG